MNDEIMFNWLGGFFDGEGSCSFAQGSPAINIVNTNPKAIMLCQNILRRNNIEILVSERSKPSKSSKKKRWDLYINKADEAIKASEFLLQYVHGKKKQLELIVEYAKERKNAKDYHEKMKYINQSNNILIKDDDVLWEKIGSVQEKTHENIQEDTKAIQLTDFLNIGYLCGVLDAEGTIGMNQRQVKYQNADRFTPVISFVNTNKEIVSKCYSTIKNLGIGAHIQFREPENRNRARWDVSVSGVLRARDLSSKIKDYLQIKKEQTELLYLYCCERMRNVKSPINDTGYNCKMAIQDLNKR